MTPQKPSRGEGDAADPRDAWLAKLDASIDSDGKLHHTATPIEPILLPHPHPASLDPEVLARACELTKGRTSGPGGQHRNKVESQVRLLHTTTGVASRAGERRSSGENRSVALERLRLHLAVLVRCPVPEGDCRSALWRTRTGGAGKTGRIVVNPAHVDYPTMLAEALDVLWAANLDPKTAGLRLVCTPSQLVKLLKEHPPALLWLNAHRVARELHALK